MISPRSVFHLLSLLIVSEVPEWRAGEDILLVFVLMHRNESSN
jgi:hypothetical protein